MNRALRFFMFLLLILAAGLACNFPGLNQNQPGSGETAPISTDDTAPSPSENLPDLIIDSITIPSPTIVREAEPWTWITFQVTNIGSSPSPDEVEAHYTLDGEKFGGSLKIEDSPLQPGESSTKQFAVGHDNMWPLGSHTVVIIVDYFDVIPESNEDNNNSNPITFEIVVP